MTENIGKKLSRRDAIKLLTATVGAATVANLPSKWSKPVLAASQLPQHARQSVECVVSEILAENINGFHTVWNFYGLPPGAAFNYTITIIGAGTISGSQFFSGSLTADSTGAALTPYLGHTEGFVAGDRIISMLSGDVSRCEYLNII